MLTTVVSLKWKRLGWLHLSNKLTMNYIQLQIYISKDPFMRHMFGGILYADEIPKYTADKTLI